MQTIQRKTVVILTGLAAALPAMAQDTQGLPHAFEAGWVGKKTCEVLFETAAVRAAHCVFPASVGHEKHYHNPHFGYVLEGGTLRIVDAEGERVVTTETGGNWTTDTVTIHSALNIGDTTTSYIIVEPKPH